MSDEEILLSTAGMELQSMFGEQQLGIWESCGVLEHYATLQASNGTERAVVQLVILAGFDKFVSPLIRDFVKPNIFDGLAVAAGKALVIYVSMAAYDAIREQS